MSNDYYVTLTGGKKNIGDFLITKRCELLLAELRPDRELKKLKSWLNLEEHLELINKSKGLIIFGGPGYQQGMYPKVYKFTQQLSDIQVPIIPMGLGWKGITGDYQTLQNYKFTQSSLRLLSKIEKTSVLSCRDYYTQNVLVMNGLSKVKMTGCPVWYDLPSLNKEMERPQEVKKVVYTPAQSTLFTQQSVEIMKVLKVRFPKAEIYCSFHRGISEKDEFTKNWEVINTTYLAQQAETLGLIPIDTSFDLEKINFYKNCDLHVGYRVHGHIYFLSKRKPSILLHEDGRGRGVSEALNLHGIDAYKRTAIGQIAAGSGVKWFERVTNKVFGKIKANREAPSILNHLLQNDLANQFVRYVGVSKVIDQNFEVMKSFLQTLP